MFKQFRFLFLTALFLLFVSWWIYLQFFVGIDDVQYHLFAASYGVIAFLGGIWGLIIAKRWGGLKSVFGRAITLFSLGLFAQEFGQLAYSYYVYFLHIDIPYPSIGDIGYFGTIPLYAGAIFYLAKASGASINVGSISHKLQIFIIPLFLLTVTYSIFLQNYVFDWGTPLTVFLDFGYPLGNAIVLSLGLLTYTLSRSVLGGIMKSKILALLFALLIQYLADFNFLYQTRYGEVVVGGGIDIFYLIAYYLMAISLLQLGSVFKKLQQE